MAMSPCHRNLLHIFARFLRKGRWTKGQLDTWTRSRLARAVALGSKGKTSKWASVLERRSARLGFSCVGIKGRDGICVQRPPLRPAWRRVCRFEKSGPVSKTPGRAPFEAAPNAREQVQVAKACLAACLLPSRYQEQPCSKSGMVRRHSAICLARGATAAGSLHVVRERCGRFGDTRLPMAAPILSSGGERLIERPGLPRR